MSLHAIFEAVIAFWLTETKLQTDVYRGCDYVLSLRCSVSAFEFGIGGQCFSFVVSCFASPST